MATAVLQLSDKFPVGTVVDAHPAAKVGQPWLGARRAKARPHGGLTPAAQATVAANGSLTLTGLNAGTPYVAVANVGGEYKYVQFGAGGYVAPRRIPHPYP